MTADTTPSPKGPSLVERLNGPHEWGYRDPVEGGWIEDLSPFEAASYITELEGRERALKAQRDHECARGNRFYHFLVANPEVRRLYVEQEGHAEWADKEAAEARAEAAEANSARRELALRAILTWRRECHAYDADMGHPLRDFGEPDFVQIEMMASAALEQTKGESGREDMASRSQPCGVRPSDVTDPQSQHSDGAQQ